MSRKTLTISEKAYRALDRAKGKDKSLPQDFLTSRHVKEIIFGETFSLIDQ